MAHLIIFGLIGLAELCGGIALLAHDDGPFGEVEGLLCFGFGFAMLAIVAGIRMLTRR